MEAQRHDKGYFVSHLAATDPGISCAGDDLKRGEFQMIPFIIGLLVGALVGMVTMALVAAGKLADERTKQITERSDE